VHKISSHLGRDLEFVLRKMSVCLKVHLVDNS
jgi:hypothetical protein